MYAFVVYSRIQTVVMIGLVHSMLRNMWYFASVTVWRQNDMPTCHFLCNSSRFRKFVANKSGTIFTFY